MAYACLLVRNLKDTSRLNERDLYRAVGGRIRQCRQEIGLTQEALANAVGLTRTSITNLEKGRQSLLVHKLVEIAVALQVQPKALLPNGGESVGVGVDQMVINKPEDEQQFVRAVLQPHNTRKRIRHALDKTTNTAKG